MRKRSIATTVSSILLTVAAVLVVASPAAASPRVKNGVVHACMKTKGKRKVVGTIRIVNSAKECRRKKGETALTWSLLGPTGTEGGARTTGPAGPQGPTGTTGAQGVRGETGAAASVENELKEVISSQSKEIQKLTTKVEGLTGEVVNLEGAVNGVEGTVGGLTKTVTDTANGLGNVEGTVAGLGTSVTNTTKSLTNLEGTVGTVQGTVTGLGTTVGKQCTGLNEVITHANALTSATSELTGALNLVLGGFLPKLPENSKAVSC